MAIDPISKLSARQRDCLRLTLVRRGSKEIARELGISAHMVDKYIKTARETLGVSSRFEAARLLADHEGIDWVQKLDPQARDLAQPVTEPPMPVSRPDQWERGSGGHLALPFPTAGRPQNDLDVWQRLGWIAAIAAVVAILMAGLASGSMTLLEAVAKLI